MKILNTFLISSALAMDSTILMMMMQQQTGNNQNQANQMNMILPFLMMDKENNSSSDNSDMLMMMMQNGENIGDMGSMQHEPCSLFNDERRFLRFQNFIFNDKYDEARLYY